MKTWWQGLSERDRRVLSVGGVSAALLLLYALAWLPLDRSREALRVQAAALDASYRWMQAAAPEVQRLSAGAGAGMTPDGRSLLARADAGARESGVGSALLRVEPVAEGQVRMVFQQVGFDALMGWLEQFSRSQGVRVIEFNVQTTGASGQVDARIGLEERR